jgi:2-iminobutanoate/2-iminopropanoate deaminase
MSQHQPKTPVFSERAPAPSGAYSQAIRAGQFVYLAGQGPGTPDGPLEDPTFEDRVRQVFANLAAVAASAGLTLADAVRFGVYLESMSDFETMDRVYREVVPEPFPARTTIACDVGGIGVEIDAVLYDPNDNDRA